MTEPATSENGETQGFALRWPARALRMVLAVVLASAAALLAYAVLLNVIIRDVPEPTTVAEDLVAELAVEAGVTPSDARQIAEEAVAYVDETLLDDSLNAADDIRLGIKVLPAVPAVLIGVGLLVIPSGRSRRHWSSGLVAVFGGGLLVVAWWLRRGALEASEVATQSIEDTAERFIGHLLAPAWPIGWTALGLGVAGWAIASARSARPQAQPVAD